MAGLPEGHFVVNSDGKTGNLWDWIAELDCGTGFDCGTTAEALKIKVLG
ncbi:hypothetical protein [Desulfofundulus thermosubterraneus]|nr:hypothetical protein [Desulfofundulus thermosubterraneus]